MDIESTRQTEEEIETGIEPVSISAIHPRRKRTGSSGSFNKTMSQWRRIAIEEMPSCRKLIEEAESPTEMWFCLREELDTPNENVRREIFEFAVRCDEDRSMPGYLAGQVDYFFHAVVGSYLSGAYAERENPSSEERRKYPFIRVRHHIGKDLPKYLTAKRFLYWAKALDHVFDAKEIAVALRHFTTR